MLARLCDFYIYFIHILIYLYLFGVGGGGGEHSNANPMAIEDDRLNLLNFSTILNTPIPSSHNERQPQI